jgi:hypothetical protein
MHINPVYALFQQLEARAQANGVSTNHMCIAAKVALSTPRRWRDDPDTTTYTVVKKLEVALDDLLSIRKVARSASVAKQSGKGNSNSERGSA